jgi:hydroxyacylglutathione hydrolase
VDTAYAKGAQITHIFETHRNEDYVSGSVELADITGATIYHGSALPFTYGYPVEDGQQFDLGSARLTILSTPGHTYESLSIALADTDFSSEPVAVFTGDALFIGETGRTDFFPDRAEEVAGLLYDSIFNKILPLGDQAIIYPAHGAGSVCGAGMASREFSTLGYERRNSPALQASSRDEFIRRKLEERHVYPPYFREMERVNLTGDTRLGYLPQPYPADHEAFAGLMAEGQQILDVRSPEALAGAYIPGSLAMPLDMIPAYAGWFLSYKQKIGLVVNGYEEVERAVQYLVRLGYDRIHAYLDGGLHVWETSGKEYDTIPAVYAGDLKRRIEAGEAFTLLDIRTREEFEAGHVQGSVHIYLGELPDRLNEVPEARPIITFCGSGRRAIIAAAILKQNGFKDVQDCLGSMKACKAVGCPLEA